MAVTILQGNDWSSTGDWTNGVPADGDTACISGGLDQNVDTGLTQGGIDLALLRTHENYARNTGASGSPLEIAAAKVEHYGRGGLYLACDSQGTPTGTIDDIEIACSGPNARNVLTELDSEASNPGDYLRINLRRGTIRILTNLTFDNTNGHVSVGKVDNDSDVTLTIVQGSDACPLLTQGAGTVNSARAITTAIVSGVSRFTQDTAAITTLHVCHGAYAILNYGGTTATATIATTVYVYAGGTLDLLQNTKFKTITTIFMFPGSTVLYDAGLHTFTTSHDWRRLRP